jgi:hypothetical protein
MIVLIHTITAQTSSFVLNVGGLSTLFANT